VSAWSPGSYVGLDSVSSAGFATTVSLGGRGSCGLVGLTAVCQTIEDDRLPCLVGEPYSGARLRSVPDDRDDGRNGGDPGGKHRVAHQRVDQGGLAAFELVDAGDVEASLGEPLDLMRGLARQRRKSRFGRELRQPSQVAESLRRGEWVNVWWVVGSYKHTSA